VVGRVQGVLFRDFTRRSALRLGIVGTVENSPDGSVLVVAEGEEDVLQQLLLILRKGSTLSRVDKVEVLTKEATHEFQTFEIRYSNLWDRL